MLEAFHIITQGNTELLLCILNQELQKHAFNCKQVSTTLTIGKYYDPQSRGIQTTVQGKSSPVWLSMLDFPTLSTVLSVTIPLPSLP